MPPEPPVSGRPNSIFYQLLRPEFVKKQSVPLVADAFSNFSIADPKAGLYCADVIKVTQTLFGNNNPRINLTHSFYR